MAACGYQVGILRAEGNPGVGMGWTMTLLAHLVRAEYATRRFWSHVCDVLAERRTGFNEHEADRYLADLMQPDVIDLDIYTCRAPGPFDCIPCSTDMEIFPCRYPIDPSSTNASATRAVDGEGSGEGSDIPPSTSPEQPTCCMRPLLDCQQPFYGVVAGKEGWHKCGEHPSTPDTADLNGDPEVELTLARIELGRAHEKLGRYRQALEAAGVALPE